MDYNYHYRKLSPATMRQDYRRSILSFYERRYRLPWNISHHFALWRDGGYWRVMQDTFMWAAAGCQDAKGRRRCPHIVRFPSFRELVQVSDRLGLHRQP